MKKLLFVCTGNTCRSSMAEGILRNLLQKSEPPLQDIEVTSAGIAVFGAGPANPKAIEVMQEMGIDITGHVAQPLTNEMVVQADLILTMTQGHKSQIVAVEPLVRDKIFSLLEYIQEEEGVEDRMLDISDPFGLSLEDYRKAATQIKEVIEKALPKISKTFFQ